MDKIKVIFDDAESSCRSLIESKEIQNVKTVVNLVLLAIGCVLFALGGAYPFFLTASMYTYYSLDPTNFIKGVLTKWLYTSKKGGLPFKTYISHVPSVISFIIAVGTVLFIIMLFLLNLWIQHGFKHVIDTKVREDVQVFEDKLVVDINKSFQTVNAVTGQFIDQLNNATFKISKTLQILFDNYRNEANMVEEEVPVIGTYVVNVLECLFGFLKFDELIDYLETVRTEALDKLKGYLTIEITPTDIGLTDTLSTKCRNLDKISLLFLHQP